MNFTMTALAVRALSAALQSLGMWEAVLPRLSPEARDMLLHPLSKAQVDGTIGFEIIGVVEALRGADAVEQLYLEQARKTFNGLVEPLLKVALILSRSTPHAVFERFDTMVGAALRGLKVRWTPDGTTAGTIAFTYPLVPPPVIERVWMGTLRHAFDVCGVQGELRALPREQPDTLRIAVSWRA